MEKSNVFKSIFNLSCVIFCILSLAFSLYCGVNANETYSFLFILPLISGFLYLVNYFLFRKINNKGLIILMLIIISLYFVRNSFSCFVLVADNFGTKFGSLTKDNVLLGCLLTVYETFFVFLFLALKCRNYQTTQYKKNSFRGKSSLNILFIIVLLISIAIAVLSLISSSDLRNSFYSIFTKGFGNAYVEQSDVTETGFTRVLYTGGMFLINSLRLVVSVVVISLLAKKQTTINLVLCLVVALLQVFFMTDSNMFILFLVFSELLLIYKLFPTKKRMMIFLGISLFVILILVILNNRFMQEGSGYSRSYSMFLQSYFPGITEIAGGIKMLEIANTDKLTFFWEDIYSNVPFRSTLFGYSGGGVTLADYFNSICETHSQILPSIIESSYYFSWFLAPISSCVSISIAFFFFKKINHCDNAIQYALYVLIVIVCIFSPITFDLRIVLHFFTSYFVLMFLYYAASKGSSFLRLRRKGEIK